MSHLAAGLVSYIPILIIYIPANDTSYFRLRHNRLTASVIDLCLDDTLQIHIMTLLVWIDVLCVCMYHDTLARYNESLL